MKIYIQIRGEEIIKTSIDSFDNSIEIIESEEVFLNPSAFVYRNDVIIQKEIAQSPLFGVEWHEQNKAMRLFVTHENNSKLSIAYPELALWFKMQENPIVAIDTGLIVYLNAMSDVEMGGTIIPMETIQHILGMYSIIIETK